MQSLLRKVIKLRVSFQKSSAFAGSKENVVMIVQSDGPVRQKAHWRGAGLAVPVFSLRSCSSVGAGEYVDLRALVDFCVATGMQPLHCLDSCMTRSE